MVVRLSLRIDLKHFVVAQEIEASKDISFHIEELGQVSQHVLKILLHEYECLSCLCLNDISHQRCYGNLLKQTPPIFVKEQVSLIVSRQILFDVFCLENRL